MTREMTNEEVIDRLTQLYEMIHYARMMKCASAAITEEYYDETQDALEGAIRALKEELDGCSDKSNAVSESV